MTSVLRARWLGRVGYDEALAVQRAIHARSDDDYLLLLEHPHTYTLGKRADPADVLVDAGSVGAALVDTDRGGDVTYHGPGQLVGYPVGNLAVSPAGMRDVVAHVRRIEEALILALAELGVAGERVEGRSGVWVGDEKIAAIGVRVARGRTMHGFALNVDTDLEMFEHIVPCGITDAGVTSLEHVLGAAPAMDAVVDTVTRAWARVSRALTVETAAVANERVPVPVPVAGPRRPDWMKVRADLGPEYRRLKRLVHDQQLHTVCEEAGCPNIYECWSQRTATFMILGDRCTRACGFCLVDTRKPVPIDTEEPARVAEAVATLGLAHAVITSVARDDVADGGADGFAATIEAVRARNPDTTVEVLIPDCKGDAGALATIFAARPDVLNHNLETVARLQRLARARRPGTPARSGCSPGRRTPVSSPSPASSWAWARGPPRSVPRSPTCAPSASTSSPSASTSDRRRSTCRWRAGSRPWSSRSWVSTPRSLGFGHVESGPLVRSSYHARDGAVAAIPVPA